MERDLRGFVICGGGAWYFMRKFLKVYNKIVKKYFMIVFTL
jgi:hypothetical protein